MLYQTTNTTNTYILQKKKKKIDTHSRKCIIRDTNDRNKQSLCDVYIFSLTIKGPFFVTSFYFLKKRKIVSTVLLSHSLRL